MTSIQIAKDALTRICETDAEYPVTLKMIALDALTEIAIEEQNSVPVVSPRKPPHPTVTNLLGKGNHGARK